MVRRLRQITLALLTMTGRVTMAGIARWTGDGGSYRTVQRFFATPLPWPELFWRFVHHHLLQTNDVYLLAGDEVVVTKAGKKTFGVARFFSSIYRQPVPSVAFFSLALVSTTRRRAFPLRLEQVVRTAAEQAATKAKAARKTATAVPPQKPGRPKGSTTQPKQEVPLSPELHRIQTMLQAQLQLMAGVIPVRYLALDGHFGNSPTVQMVRQCGLHLISKLRSDAALYMPYTGPYHGRGPRRKYGDKLDLRVLPVQYLVERSIEDTLETCVYQAELLHKAFAQPLNVVILVKTNLVSAKRAYVVLFSSDLALPAATLIDYYSLRFQIEFTFRDAKQYWGLEDFMNIGEVAVTNAATLSLFMVNLTAVLADDQQRTENHESILDLKAAYRGYKYALETIKLLPNPPDEHLLGRIVGHITRLGRIHLSESRLDAAQVATVLLIA